MLLGFVLHVYQYCRYYHLGFFLKELGTEVQILYMLYL